MLQATPSSPGGRFSLHFAPPATATPEMPISLLMFGKYNSPLAPASEPFELLRTKLAVSKIGSQRRSRWREHALPLVTGRKLAMIPSKKRSAYIIKAMVFGMPRVRPDTIVQDGVEYLFWSDPFPRRLVVNFTSMNPGKFERWSWFADGTCDTPSAYLFFRDERQHYYLGPKDQPMTSVYAGIIKRLVQQWGADMSLSVTVGSSMAGYAAVYYGILLGFAGAVCINPQVDLESAKLHRYSLWTRKMSECAWIDLDQFVRQVGRTQTFIYLRHGRYPADVQACHKLSAALDTIGASYVREVDDTAEHGWAGISRERLLELIDMVASARQKA